MDSGAWRVTVIELQRVGDYLATSLSISACSDGSMSQLAQMVKNLPAMWETWV